MCVEYEAATWPLGILKSLSPRILSAGDPRLLFICSLFIFPKYLLWAWLCRALGFRGKADTVLVLGSPFYQSWCSLPQIQPEHLATCPKRPSGLSSPLTGPLRALPGPDFASGLATSGEKPSMSALFQKDLSFICAEHTSKPNPS